MKLDSAVSEVLESYTKAAYKLHYTALVYKRLANFGGETWETLSTRMQEVRKIALGLYHGLTKAIAILGIPEPQGWSPEEQGLDSDVIAKVLEELNILLAQSDEKAPL